MNIRPRTYEWVLPHNDEDLIWLINNNIEYLPPENQDRVETTVAKYHQTTKLYDGGRRFLESMFYKIESVIKN